MVADTAPIAGSATAGVASRRVSIGMGASDTICRINASNATPTAPATAQSSALRSSITGRGIEPTSQGILRSEPGLCARHSLNPITHEFQ